MKDVKLFISSVSDKFKSYRDHLRQRLTSPHVEVKIQEDFIAGGTVVLDKLDACIQKCDAVLPAAVPRKPAKCGTSPSTIRPASRSRPRRKRRRLTPVIPAPVAAQVVAGAVCIALLPLRASRFLRVFAGNAVNECHPTGRTTSLPRPMIQLEALRPTDLPAIPIIQPHDWPDVLPFHRFYLASAFCLPLKATVDGRLAGVGTAIVHHDVAWLAHVIVHPDFRQQGIGRRLTETLVERVQDRCPTIYLIATEQGAPVYEKVGFVTETNYLFFADVRLPPTVPAAGIEPYQAACRSQVAAIDRAISGESRLFHLESHLAAGVVYRVADEVQGFYLPTFGEGLLLATTAEAGRALLRQHLHARANVAFPEENHAAAAFLRGHGFQEFKKAKRMRWGHNRPVQLASIYNRIGGNLG